MHFLLQHVCNGGSSLRRKIDSFCKTTLMSLKWAENGLTMTRMFELW